MLQVATHAAQFAQLQTQIVTISFVGEPFVSAWLTETQSPFEMMVDEPRALYKGYGLGQSALRAWGVRNLWYYAKALASGRKTKGKRGDTHPLGGNFIIDTAGLVRYAHPSRDPTDRPSVNDLTEVLKRLP